MADLSAFNEVCERLNQVISHAEKCFAARFRIAATVELSLGELRFGKGSGSYGLYLVRDTAPESQMHWAKENLEARLAIAKAIPSLWRACLTASDESLREIADASQGVLDFLAALPPGEDLRG